MISTISAIKDLSTNKWVVRKEIHPVRGLKLSIGFTRGDNTEFQLGDLKFSVKIYRNSGEKERLALLSWPISEKKSFNGQDNVAPYLVERELDLDVDETFKFIIEGGQGDLLSSHESFFTINRPTKPYPSWIWDGNNWIAPVGPNTNNQYLPSEQPVGSSDKDVYYWDESQAKWVLDVDEIDPRLALEREDRVIDPNNPLG